MMIVVMYVRSAYQMFCADRLSQGLPQVSMSRFCKSLMIEALGSDEELVDSYEEREEKEQRKH